MPTSVEVPAPFLNELRQLAKKYRSVLEQVEALAGELKADQRPGDKIPGVGYDVYKVRLPNPAAGRGKSGGFRVIYYVQVADRVLLLTIYAKTEQSDVTPAQIRRILEDLVPPEG